MTTSVPQILNAVYSATGVHPLDIMGKTRTEQVAVARFLAMLIYAESRPFASDNETGRAFGKQGHGTGRHALKRARAMMESDANFQRAYQLASNHENRD